MLSPAHYAYYVSFRQSLSGVDLTVSERDVQSRSSSELLRWRVRKVRSPSHQFLLILLFFCPVWGFHFFFYFFLISVIWGGSRKCSKLGLSLSSDEIRKKSRKIQYSSRNQCKCLSLCLYKISSFQTVLKYPQVSFSRAATQCNSLLSHFVFLRHESRNKGMKHSWKNIPSFLGIEPSPPG